MTKFGHPNLLSSDINRARTFRESPKADALPDCATPRLLFNYLESLAKAYLEYTPPASPNSAHVCSKMQANEGVYCDKIWTVIWSRVFGSRAKDLTRSLILFHPIDIASLVFISRGGGFILGDHRGEAVH